MAIVLPCHLLLQWKLMQISMIFHGLAGYLWCWRLFMYDTPLKLPYMDIWRSGPVSCLKERAIDLSEGQGHIPYMGEHVFWKAKDGHLTTLSQFLLLFHLIWNLEKSHQICAGWFGHIYFYKINSKSEWKNIWNPAENHCLLWAQVREFTFC